jgi:hypothetical protein
MIHSDENAKPDFWLWLRYITTDWKAPKGAYRLIGFATILATKGHQGADLYASAGTLAKQAGVSRRQIYDLRTKCVEVGLFRNTGAMRYGVPVLEIAIPPNAGEVVRQVMPSAEPKTTGPKHTGEGGTGCSACYAFVADGGSSTDMMIAHRASKAKRIGQHVAR